MKNLRFGKFDGLNKSDRKMRNWSMLLQLENDQAVNQYLENRLLVLEEEIYKVEK